MLARKFRGQQQETSYTGPHPFEGGDIRSVGNNPPARLPLDKSPLQPLQAPTLTNETSKAYQQVLQNLRNRLDLPVGKTRNARVGYVENPLILNQNRIIDVDTTPQYLQQPNPYTQPDVDPRLLRQLASERLQAAQQQLAQIVQPPDPKLQGRVTYQSTAFNNLRASQQQAQDRELQRLQLEQLRQQLIVMPCGV